MTLRVRMATKDITVPATESAVSANTTSVPGSLRDSPTTAQGGDPQRGVPEAGSFVDREGHSDRGVLPVRSRLRIPALLSVEIFVVSLNNRDG